MMATDKDINVPNKSDYISRQAAINIVCDDECDDCPDGGCDMYRRLKRLPAADAVEVVRCKDCEHFVPNSKIDSLCSGFCRKANWSKKWNDFCSDGERSAE